MSIGVFEIAVVMVAFAVLGAVALFRREWFSRRRWLAFVPFLLLTAALTSPADVMSMLIVAVPHLLMFAIVVKFCLPRRTPA